MGVRDHLERVAAWFGFGVDEDDYYEEEEDDGRRYAGKSRYPDETGVSEPGPAVRRLGRAERSSAFGTSLGDLFGGESAARGPLPGAWFGIMKMLPYGQFDAHRPQPMQ